MRNWNGLVVLGAAALVTAWSSNAAAQEELKKLRPERIAPIEADPSDEQPAADAADAGSGEAVALVEQPTFDFGQVWVNEMLEHTFVIRNTGDTVLKIEKVKPACGCTLAGRHPTEIAPGGSGEFPFRLNTNKINGRFTKAITILTSAPKNQQIQLALTGEVKHYVEVVPSLAQFGRVKPDSELTRQITLKNNTDELLELSIVKEQEGCFSAELRENEPGKVYELIVTAKPPFQTGINRFSLDLTTNVEKQKVLNIICMATLPQRLELRPDRIRISPNARTESVRKIWFTNNGDTAVNVVSAEPTDARLQVESQEIEGGQKYQFTVTIPPNYSPSDPGTAIVLKTDDPAEAEVRIPIESLPQPRARRPERPAMQMLGQTVPARTVTAHDGESVQIGGEQDKVQILMFYASWCGFCKRALPKTEELHAQFANENKSAEVVLINLDDREGRRARTEQQSIDHYKETGLKSPLILDSKKELGGPFKVTSFPTMFVMSKQGVVEAVHVGAAANFEKQIAQEVDILLAGKSRKDFPQAAADVGSAVMPRTPLAIESLPVRPAMVANPAAAVPGAAAASEQAPGRVRAVGEKATESQPPAKGDGSGDSGTP